MRVSQETVDGLGTKLAALMLWLGTFGSFLEIKTKSDGKVAFGYGAWHPEQQRFERERTGHDIVLKPRQIGFSTLELARDIQYARTHQGVQVVIIVHTGDAKTELFDAVHLMARSLAEWGLLPKPRENTKTGLRWDDNDSSIKVIEAGQDESTADNRGRSGTIHRLHATEVAFYGSPEKTMNAVMNAVPSSGEIVIESTANGVGNWFHSKVVQSRSRRFANFRFHFFPWFEHLHYREDPRAYRREPETKRERYWEERLRGLGCDAEQIAWWRKTVEEMTLDDAIKDFPPTADAAFESSGDTWIEPEHLDRLESCIREPIELWPIVRAKRTTHDGHTRPEARFGMLRVFEPPERGESYIIGADPSGGVGRDEAALCVMTQRGARVVACWDDCHTKPGDLGNVLAVVGRRYNDATIACEIQLDGRAGRETLAVLEREEGYQNLFEYKPGRTGWSTDELTRPLLFGDAGKAIAEGSVSTPDAKTVGECRTLVPHPKTGKIGARGKGNKSGTDDGLFIAWAIALQVRARVPRTAAMVSNIQLGGELSSTGFRT